MVILNSRGIHLRPSSLISAAIRDYSGTVSIEKEDGTRVGGKSPLEILGLGLTQYSAITLTVDGPEEAEFCQRLVELFAKHFDFA